MSALASPIPPDDPPPDDQAPATHQAARTTLNIVAAVDSAVDEHLRWLHAWNRALICREALPPEMTSPGSATLCGFGAWYELHRHDGGLVDQPAFHELAEAHRRLHEQSLRLGELAARGATVPVAEYDRLVESVDAFNARARRISAAFQRLLSDLDPLTGAHSRQTMMAELEREAVRARRTGAPLCLAMVDLDHFKRVNDTYGHGAGDRVLAATAARLLAHMRPYDTVFRYGGEEFLLCLPNADLTTAEAVCQRLRHAIGEAPVEVEGSGSISITASFGVAYLASGPVKNTVAAADQALYAAKRGGRNRVEVSRVVWSPAAQ